MKVFPKGLMRLFFVVYNQTIIYYSNIILISLFKSSQVFKIICRIFLSYWEESGTVIHDKKRDFKAFDCNQRRQE